MTKTPDEHALAVEEGKVSPVIVIVTILLIALFVVAVLYRVGVTLL